MDSKSPFLSKTLWINFITAASAFIPGAGDFVAHHPEWVLTGFALINMGLRLITKQPIEIQ